MKRILLLLLTFSIVFGGCASSLPQMPDVKTQIGRDCVRSCRYEHTLCVDACGGAPKVLPEKSGSDCDHKLEDCYERCIEEEKCHRKDFGRLERKSKEVRSGCLAFSDMEDDGKHP